MMTSLHNIVILGTRAPDVDGIKIFDKVEQAAKHYNNKNSVLCPGHLYQKFDPISHQNQEALST